MLISNINRNTEKRIYSQNQSIMEAEELLYNVVDASLSAAGDNLEIEENEHRKDHLKRREKCNPYRLSSGDRGKI